MSGKIAETLLRPRVPSPGPNHYYPENSFHKTYARPQTFGERTGGFLGIKLNQNPSPLQYSPGRGVERDNNMVSGFSPQYAQACDRGNSPGPNAYVPHVTNTQKNSIRDISFKMRIPQQIGGSDVSPQRYSPVVRHFSPDIKFKSRMPQKLKVDGPSPQEYVVDFNKIAPSPQTNKVLQKPYNASPGKLKARDATPGPGAYETDYRRALKASSLGVRYNDRVNNF